MVTSLLYVCVTVLAPVLSVKFKVTAQDKVLVAELGSDASIPCTLSPPLGALGIEVRWFRNHYYSPTFLLVDGEEKKEAQSQEYRGRTSLKYGPETGDLTLTLRKVRLSDAGKYHCFVENTTTHYNDEAETELSVIGVGSHPTVDVSLQASSILLSFSSFDWFPTPQMLWESEDGTNLTAETQTYLQQSDGLFRVESRVLLQDPSMGNLYCAVRHPLTGKDTGLFLKISEDLFPRVSSWAYAFAFTLFLLIVILLLTFWYVRELRTEKEKLTESVGDLRSDVEWRTAVMSPVKIKFSPETVHPELSVSPDCLTLSNRPPDTDPKENDSRFKTERCCLGLPPFSTGCYYWEVELGEGLEWAVGVATKEVQRKGSAYMFSPQEHIWCMSHFVETFRALDDPEATLKVKDDLLERVGVYLNLSTKWTISFYDPSNWTRLYTFTMRPEKKEEVYPFFWLGLKGSEVRLMGHGSERMERRTEQEEDPEREHLLHNGVD
ncbi:butyrophilin subfamily 1 member A1-like [Rhinophrynus dorsalis]